MEEKNSELEDIKIEILHNKKQKIQKKKRIKHEQVVEQFQVS